MGGRWVLGDVEWWVPGEGIVEEPLIYIADKEAAGGEAGVAEFAEAQGARVVSIPPGPLGGGMPLLDCDAQGARVVPGLVGAQGDLVTGSELGGADAQGARVVGGMADAAVAGAPPVAQGARVVGTPVVAVVVGRVPAQGARVS